MTNKAKIVLEDCRNALGDLYDEPNGMKWRVIWVGTITLLRAVGHVLENEDSKVSEEMAKAINEAWESWKKDLEKNKIFFEFIKLDRDLILKEYRFRAGVGVTINVPTAVLNSKFEQIGQLGEGKVEYDYEITDGPFKDKDQRELVEEAIGWWKERLDEIDARAAALKIEKQGII